MSLQLHEWLNEFIAAHGLDTDVENTSNEGLYVLSALINDERENDYEKTYRKTYADVKCMTLAEFAKYDHTARNIVFTPELNEEDYQLTDFLYERKSGYVIINLRFNSSLPHENMMGMLYNAIEHKNLNMPEGAEAYIEKYGFSLSSVSYFRNILLGDSFVLNAQEKAAFSSYNFER
jgi:hypothetical protein